MQGNKCIPDISFIIIIIISSSKKDDNTHPTVIHRQHISRHTYKTQLTERWSSNSSQRIVIVIVFAFAFQRGHRHGGECSSHGGSGLSNGSSWQRPHWRRNGGRNGSDGWRRPNWVAPNWRRHVTHWPTWWHATVRLWNQGKGKRDNTHVASQAATAAAMALYVTNIAGIQIISCRLSPRPQDFDLRWTAV